jgi:aminomethyltransferase
MTVKNSDGHSIGEVTSGTFSPLLKHGIALARVETTVKLGDKLIIDVRGREGNVAVVKLPFVASKVR